MHSTAAEVTRNRGIYIAALTANKLGIGDISARPPALQTNRQTDGDRRERESGIEDQSNTPRRH